MEVIPVIDVRNGIAVRAVAGDRASYRGLETPLAAGSDPVAIALGYRSLFPFSTIYVADLDGIEGRGRNGDLPARLADALPGVAFWIDDGAVTGGGHELPPSQVRVIGSESLRFPSPRGEGWGEGQLHAAARVSAPHPNPPPIKDGERGNDWVLSLDFRGEEFLGPRALLEDCSPWPDRIIVMTLARVGTGGGPDLARIGDIARRAGAGRKVYAAGGVRGLADLLAVRDAGAAGALVATALHAGKIKAGDLREIAGS